MLKCYCNQLGEGRPREGDVGKVQLPVVPGGWLPKYRVDGSAQFTHQIRLGTSDSIASITPAARSNTKITLAQASRQ